MKSSTTSDRPGLFVDTWGWLALEDAAEPAHAEVRRIRERYADEGGQWVTTDYVLDETITRLFARRPFPEAKKFMAGLFQAQELGLVNVETITSDRFQKAYELRLRYRDKPRISFTDLTSFVVAAELSIRHVLTRDAHFRQTQLGLITLP